MIEKKERQSNFELLRIIAIIMIIAHHFAYHSDMQFDTTVISLNRLWTQLLFYGGHVGLDMFVLISGYFLIDSKRLNLAKIARIWLMMFSYSVGIYLFISITGIEVEFFDEIKNWSFTPAARGIWPFASAYLGLMFLYPFVNYFVRSISKEVYRVLMIILLTLWSVIPTVTTFDMGSNYLLWMITLYLLSGYIKLYPEDFERGKKYYLRILFVFLALSYASAVACDIIGLKYSGIAKYATHFSGMQHINIVVMAVCLFLVFKDIKIENAKAGKIINSVAGTTFGIFLIHDNTFLKLWIWKQLFRNAKYIDSPWFIPASAGEVIVIFVVCMIIEYIRQNLLERWYMKGIGKLLEKPQKFLDEVMDNK